MKTYSYLLIILSALIYYGCSDNENTVKKQRFSISSVSLIDNSLLQGGQYKITDANGNTIETYTLDKGTIDISNFISGTFTVEEIAAPDGYIGEHKQQQIYLLGELEPHIIFYYIKKERSIFPKNKTVKFYSHERKAILGEYNAVRIGEYYWIDQNFTHIVPWGADYENSHPMTQAVLDKYLERIRIDPKEYQLEDINEFEKYYGRYYSYPSILYMNQHCIIQNENGQEEAGWKLPFREDYRQLFAMCPFNTSHDKPHTNLNERDVRFSLSVKKNENPLAYDIRNENISIYKTYWFENYNTNMYNFNLMPGGARVNGDNALWCNGLGPIDGCYTDSKKGDIYALFYTAKFATVNANDPLRIEAVIIHDYVDTGPIQSYHLMNVRWCKRLTDFELGYKLYINNDQTDIIKLDLEETPPTGYRELPNGYTRGFYVQYILDNPSPTVSVRDIIKYAKQVEDHYVFEYSNNNNIIL